MTIWFWLAAIGFPPVAALMSLSIDYGYKGANWDQAIGNARSVGMGAALFSVASVILAALPY